MAPSHRSLDAETADRLAGGGLRPDDTPPGFRRVAGLLQAAATIPPAGSSDESGVVGAMASAVRHELTNGPTTIPARRRPLKKKTVLAAAFAALTLSASAAGAATGTLPDALQEKVAGAAAHVGVNLPRPGHHGVDRVIDGCVPADDDGNFAKNRGQYLKQERAKGAEAFAAAEASRCGMPVNSKDDGENEAEDDAPAEEKQNQGKAGEKGNGAENGKAGQDHGSTGTEKSEAGEDNSQAPAGQENGKAGEERTVPSVAPEVPEVPSAPEDAGKHEDSGKPEGSGKPKDSAKPEDEGTNSDSDTVPAPAGEDQSTGE